MASPGQSAKPDRKLSRNRFSNKSSSNAAGFPGRSSKSTSPPPANFAPRRFRSIHRLLATLASQLKTENFPPNFASSDALSDPLGTQSDQRSAKTSSASVGLAPRARRILTSGEWHLSRNAASAPASP